MTKTAGCAGVPTNAASQPIGAHVTATTQDVEAETTENGLHRRDVLLVALTVASGAVDAISYFGLGKIFSAFMTGNMVFLGFGIANLEGPCVPVVLALSIYAAGAYLGWRITTWRSPESGVWPRRMSVLLALVAIAEAGFLTVWVATAGQPSTAITDVLIVLFSLAMGIQTAAVRSLGVQGVFTTAGTFTLVAFAETLAGSRPRSEIPRLVGVLVGLVAGAIGGGLLVVHARSYAPVLPLVITVLVIVAGRAAIQASSRRSARRTEHRRQERVVLGQPGRDSS
ncbi:YoaK family protein [Rhodococcus sp. NPDC059968]|uniref:YoaK family protein n=1 Tax=Rhodococcus sp. NPDC059968 TaxID=3347017 RepID=UPI00366DDE21